MRWNTKAFAILLCFAACVPAAEISGAGTAILWREPADIASRNLFYGSGGSANAPRGPMTFVKEDLDGSSPKFVVRDARGGEWKVKLGREAQSETAATRLVWAAGYFTDEDYYVPELQVANLPKLRRGQNLVEPGGLVRSARLERVFKDREKTAYWRWRRSPFADTREVDGLLVLMSLINNWDLKDVNNSVYTTREGALICVVSDLGASFGSAGFSFPKSKSRSNLESYRDSAFVRRAGSDEVDFEAPHRPAFIRAFGLPDYMKRLSMQTLGRDIPRQHVKWIAGILSKLSSAQIRDAFRAGGYTPEEIEGFAKVVESRIAQLNEL